MLNSLCLSATVGLHSGRAAATFVRAMGRADVFSHLDRLREYELERVLPDLADGSRILEIGAGAGWQAKQLAERGFSVDAIDVAESPFREHTVWQVMHYDGIHIPFPSESVDIVFSSQVLQHIPHLDSFQYEIMRVLKPHGLAVHVTATASWRAWTTLAHYAHLAKLVAARFAGHQAHTASADVPQANSTRAELMHTEGTKTNWRNRALDMLAKAVHVSVPRRLGERGNWLTEQYLLSRFYWLKVFRSTGWKVKAYRSSRLFYTGYDLLGERLPITARRRFSYVLGSSSLIYVLQKP